MRNLEVRVASFQLEVESVNVSTGGGEGGAEVHQALADLTLRPVGPVVGAIAGRAFPFEPLGPGAQAFQALEERGVGDHMFFDDGRGPFPGIGLSSSFDSAFTLGGTNAAKDPTDQRCRVEA